MTGAQQHRLNRRGASRSLVSVAGVSQKVVDQLLHLTGTADNVGDQVLGLFIVPEALLESCGLEAELSGSLRQALLRAMGVEVACEFRQLLGVQESLSNHQVADPPNQCASADGTGHAPLLDDHHAAEGYPADELVNGSDRRCLFVADHVWFHQLPDRLSPPIERD